MPTPFADALKNPADIKRVATAFHQIITKSFIDDRSRVTMSETRRRFQILERWFRDLRGQKQWTIQRTLDNLGFALRAELDGGTWTPDNRQLWIPQDGLAR